MCAGGEAGYRKCSSGARVYYHSEIVDLLFRSTIMLRYELRKRENWNRNRIEIVIVIGSWMNNWAP